MASSPTDAVIVGVGMMTAVGLSAPETAASVRAATMRFTQTPIRDRRFDSFTLAEVPEDGLPPLADSLEREPGLTAREIRMLRLGTMPLIEALSALPQGEKPPGLALALPETQPGHRIDGAAFLKRFSAQTGARFDASRSAAVDEGRAGALVAVARAAQLVRSGQANVAIAGAIDSYRDLYVLGTLDLEERVKSAEHLDGFVPGEGAAFLLLANATVARAAGLRPLATLTRVALDEEPGHLYSTSAYRGEGLAKTFKQLLGSGDVVAPIAEVYSSMNGESHWAKEWGVGYMRNKKGFAEEYGMHHPADCLGETGSACGPLLVGLAALGLRDGYRKSPSLVYCSSDRGPRAALVIAAPG
jgi:3-oxoacyl-[acyl-carrier-protein] synthase-1